MIRNIAQSYLFASEISRLEFVVGVLVAGLAVRVITSLLLQLGVIPMGLFDFWHFIAAGVCLAVLATPLFVARLKDLDCPPALSILLIAPVVPLLLYQYHKATGGIDASFQSAWYVNASNYLSFALVVFALVLAFWPGKTTKDL